MNSEIKITHKNNFPESFRNKIQKTIIEVLERIEEKFKIPQLDILIDDDANSTIPETGVGGFTDSNSIFIHIDPNFKEIEKDLEVKIKRTFTHEFNHVIRNQYFPWDEATLLEAFITEGLADHFDIEINGGEPYPWSLALSKEEFVFYLNPNSEELFSKDFDYGTWFFGSNSPKIPKWAGYSIGFYLVKNYMHKTGKSASELVNVSAENFLI